jgi:hypothetical protein
LSRMNASWTRAVACSVWSFRSPRICQRRSVAVRGRPARTVPWMQTCRPVGPLQ